MITRPVRPGPTPQLRRWLHHYHKPHAHSAQVIVVGLGPMGWGTAYHLAGQGIRVLGLDHISRRGGYPGEQTAFSMIPDCDLPADARLARRAQELWHEAEQATDGQTQLRLEVGLLRLTSNSAGAIGAPDRAMRMLTRRAAHVRIELQHLDGVEVRRRFPALSPASGTRAWLEPGGGLMRSECALKILEGLARRRGATRVLEEVVSILPDDDGIDVVTTRQTYRAARVVVAAGAWTPALVGLPAVGLRLITQEQHWYGVSQREAFTRARLPAFQWQHGSDRLDAVEGFPIDDGCGLWPPSPITQFKVAALVGIDDYATADPNPPDDEWGRAGRFRRERLAGTVHSLKERDNLAYFRRWVVASDGRYVVDRAPLDRRIIVAFGGPVTRFHDSIAVAEHVAAVVTRAEDVRPAFALDRPALTGN